MSTTNALSNSFLRRGFVVLAVFLASCGARMSEIDPGASGNRPFGCAVFDNAVFFSAFDRTSGFELWKSDGTEAGTVRVKDINPGASGSIPGGFTVFNNALYFSAFDATSGFELWRSDGTEAGTVRVKDINPGPGGSSPFGFTISNNALYFSADDGTNGFELWKSDGTEPGTVRVNDISRVNVPQNSGGTLNSASVRPKVSWQSCKPTFAWTGARPGTQSDTRRRMKNGIQHQDSSG